MIKKKFLSIISLTTIFFWQNSFADPEPITNFFDETTIDGKLRLYDFTREFNAPNTTNQTSFAMGGDINALSGPLFFPGLQMGATFYTSQSLGLNSSNPEDNVRLLPSSPINVLGQAFLQYKNPFFLVRAGNQLIDTPWLNPADSTMIPATYQGIATYITPWHNLDFTLLRVLRYKSRTSNEFNQTNLYNVSNYGGTNIPAYGDTPNNGAFAMGSSYQLRSFMTHAWYYQFYDLAKMGYADAKYILNTNTAFNPLFGTQVLYERGDGSNLLEQVGKGKAHASMLGALTGVVIPRGSVTVGYDYIPVHRNAFNNGDIMSPYTTGYDYDPLYADGLVERTAGSSVKFTVKYFILPEQLRLMASYTEFYTYPLEHNSNATNLDLTYFFHGKLEGFSVRNRFRITNGNPVVGRAIYERVMLQYLFRV